MDPTIFRASVSSGTFGRKSCLLSVAGKKSHYFDFIEMDSNLNNAVKYKVFVSHSKAPSSVKITQFWGKCQDGWRLSVTEQPKLDFNNPCVNSLSGYRNKLKMVKCKRKNYTAFTLTHKHTHIRRSMCTHTHTIYSRQAQRVFLSSTPWCRWMPLAADPESTLGHYNKQRGPKKPRKWRAWEEKYSQIPPGTQPWHSHLSQLHWC